MGRAAVGTFSGGAGRTKDLVWGQLHMTLGLWLEHLAEGKRVKHDRRFQKKKPRAHGVLFSSHVEDESKGKCPAGR